jgi:type I restriction enzyme S subunit
LASLPIPLPPLSEQRRIAAILDKADALRAKRRETLARLDELTQAFFVDAFGDAPENSKGWPVAPLGELAKIRRGASPRPIDDYLGGDINWIKIGDGTTGSDLYLERTKEKITRAGLPKSVYLKAGSLIFANCGVSLGFARILKIDGCIHDGWLALEDIKEDKLDKVFLLKLLNSMTGHFRRMAPEGTQPNLNTQLMNNFKVILPPLKLQQHFAACVQAVEGLKSGQRALLTSQDLLFASLQHRAFVSEL